MKLVWIHLLLVTPLLGFKGPVPVPVPANNEMENHKNKSGQDYHHSTEPREYELMPFGRGCPPGRDFTKKDCRKLNKKVPSLKYGETGNFNGFLPKCFLYGKKTVYYNKGGRVPPTKSKYKQKAICKKKRTACGKKNENGISDYIINGQDTGPNEWPWMAAIMQPKGNLSFCGGTLISESHVITAAHCVHRDVLCDFGPEFIVRVGEHSFKQEGETAEETFKIASIKIHKDYNPVTLENDIAILKLDGLATRSALVSPICLPPPYEKFTDKKAHAIGWGLMSFAPKVPSPVLQEVEVGVWENKYCAKKIKDWREDPNTNATALKESAMFPIRETNICAHVKGKTPCFGDSGGSLNCLNPATNSWVLCGIVSWGSYPGGSECVHPELPVVYARVTEFLPWIRNVVTDPGSVENHSSVNDAGRIIDACEPGSGSELEARAREFVKYAEKQLEAAEKQLEKLGKEAQANPVASPPAQYYLPAMVLAQAHEEELRKKMDERKPWLTFDQDLMRKLDLIKKGQKPQI